MTSFRADRRTVLTLLGAGAAIPLFGSWSERAEARPLRVNLTEAQWRSRLTSAQFGVLREEATERPYSSPLNLEHRAGTFTCAGCTNNLFSSDTKFESGTGWPSFFRPLQNAIGTKVDHKLGYPRREVHCVDCGGHLGHLFNDGPRPTGLRYCMNGVAMNFSPR